MAKRITAFIILLLTISGICFMSACHSNAAKAPATRFGFKDEQSMRQALQGTWILQEYMDSVDAGLTPKLLEYLLGSRSCINYDLKQFTTSGFQTSLNKNLNYDNSAAENYQLSFDVAHNKLIIKVTIDTTISDIDAAGKPVLRTASLGKSTETDTAEFMVEYGDTILRLHRDSMQTNFVKYDNSRCEHVDAYSHLINSKFIAGKYYRLDDQSKARHIIFTRCGNIEGPENIEPSLTENTQYGVSLTNFSTTPDAIEFYNPKYKMGRTYYWEVNEDSLILSHDPDGKGNPIVLVKVQ
jgi:hypothetical protein